MKQNEFEYKLEEPVEVMVDGHPEIFDSVTLRAPKFKYIRNGAKIEGLVSYAQKKMWEGVFANRERIQEQEEEQPQEEQQEEIDPKALRKTFYMGAGNDEAIIDALFDNFEKIAVNGGIMFGSAPATKYLLEQLNNTFDDIMWEYIAYFLHSSQEEKKGAKN